VARVNSRRYTVDFRLASSISSSSAMGCDLAPVLQPKRLVCKAAPLRWRKGDAMNVSICRIKQGAEQEPALSCDDELAQRVRMYLVHAGHRPVQVVDVEAHNGVVTLRGRVPSYYIRQLAISCAQRVAGVRAVNDQIKAALPKPRPLSCCLPVPNHP
jgi:BON domain